MKISSIRLPLQVGTSGLLSIYRFSSTAVPGLLLLLLTPRAYAVSQAFGVMSCLGGIMLGAYAVKHFLRALRERPSDMIFNHDRVRIDGGPFHGMEIAGDAVPQSFTLVETREIRTTLRGILTVSLIEIPLLFLSPFILIILFIEIFGVAAGIVLLIVLFFAAAAIAGSVLLRKIFYWFGGLIRKNGYPPRVSWISRKWGHVAERIHLKRPVSVFRLKMSNHASMPIIAEADRPGEQRSLKLLFETLKNFQKGNHVSSGGSREIVLLTCRGCGSPLAPDDAETVRCPYCREETAIAPELRARVKAASKVAKLNGLSSRLLKRLLDQPDARYSAQTLFRGSCALLAVWPLTSSLALWLYAGGSLDFNAGWAMGLGATVMTSAVLLIVQARFSDRQALRIMALEFGSIPPDKEGGPHLCHACGAPLPDVPEALSIQCIYCNADNIRGLDLRRQVAPEADQLTSLENSMRAREAGERRRALSLAVSPFLIVLSTVGFFPGLGLVKAPLVDMKFFNYFFGTRESLAALSGLPGPRTLFLNTDYTEVAMDLQVLNGGSEKNDFRDGSIYQIQLFGGSTAGPVAQGIHRPLALTTGRNSRFGASSVYWIAGNKVFGKPLPDGPVRVIAGDQSGPALIAAGNDRIYFYNSRTRELMETGVNGAGPRALTRIDGEMTALVAVSGGFGFGVYWIYIPSSQAADRTGTLAGICSPNEGPVILATGIDASAGLSYLKYPEHRLYWSEKASGGPGSAVREAPLPGRFTAGRIIATVPAGISSLTVTSGGDMIHWIEGRAPHARILRRHSGVTEVLVRDVDTASIAFTNRTLYWTETGTGKVMKRLEHPWESY